MIPKKGDPLMEVRVNTHSVQQGPKVCLEMVPLWIYVCYATATVIATANVSSLFGK